MGERSRMASQPDVQQEPQTGAQAQTINPAHARILRHFTYDHLPPDLQDLSRPFCDLAHHLATTLTTARDPAEVTVGLRKLLEAKDCIVRCMVK